MLRKPVATIRKPCPAPIYEKRFERYRIHFSYDGKQYKRFYIQNQQEAYLLQEEVNHRLRLFKAGVKLPPPGVSLPEFVFENFEETSHISTPLVTISTLSELIDEYLKLSVPPAKSASTCKTEKIHLKHLRRFVAGKKYGDPFLRDIKIGFFDHYKKFRYAEKIRTDTVNKELGTFQCLFQQAVAHGCLEYNIVREVKRDKSEARLEYKTLAEIEELRKSGRCPPQKLREMMRLCYLTPKEIIEIIRVAEGTWLHPLLIAYANTGMRKGEVLKLTWADVDLENRVLFAGSRKQSRTKQRPVRLDNSVAKFA